MLDKQAAAGVVAALKAVYPAAECSLSYEGEPWKLLVMAILSAQCTDKRVNIVSETLFARFTTPEAVADCELTELEAIVLPCGLYKTKAKNIRASCALLVEKYGSVVPDTVDELLTLPGVGRKIANLIVGDIYKKPAIVTDTHCIRISNRLGLCGEAEKTPLAIEKKLAALIEPAEQSDFCHRMVLFGREYCAARSPRCAVCPLASVCEQHL
jgi:Predicted EndoIII-related endonuclease